jgi:hypothetical protein
MLPLATTGLRAASIAAGAGVLAAWVGAQLEGSLATLVLGGAVFGVLSFAGCSWLGDAPMRAAADRVLVLLRISSPAPE